MHPHLNTSLAFLRGRNIEGQVRSLTHVPPYIPPAYPEMPTHTQQLRFMLILTDQHSQHMQSCAHPYPWLTRCHDSAVRRLRSRCSSQHQSRSCSTPRWFRCMPGGSTQRLYCWRMGVKPGPGETDGQGSWAMARTRRCILPAGYVGLHGAHRPLARSQGALAILILLASL